MPVSPPRHVNNRFSISYLQYFVVAQNCPPRWQCAQSVPVPAQAAHPINEIRLVDDVLPPLYRLGSVPCDLHRDAPWHTGSLEVQNGSPPKVVGYPPGTPRRLAGVFPRCPEISNRPAIAMKNPGTDHTPPTQLALEPLLLLQPRAQLRQFTERQDPAQTVLRCPGIEPYDARPHIHLPPLNWQNLAPNPPSGE